MINDKDENIAHRMKDGKERSLLEDRPKKNIPELDEIWANEASFRLDAYREQRLEGTSIEEIFLEE